MVVSYHDPPFQPVIIIFWVLKKKRGIYVNEFTFKGCSSATFSFASFLKWDQLFKERICSHEQILSLRVDPIFKGQHNSGIIQGSKQEVKVWLIKMEMYPYTFKMEFSNSIMDTSVSNIFLSYDVAVIQWITSCHKNHMNTPVITYWSVDITSLTTSKSTTCFYLK